MPMTRAQRLLAAVVLVLAFSTAGDEPKNALDALRRSNPAVAAGLGASEREVLKALTPRQAVDFAEGRAAVTIVLRDGRSLDQLLTKMGGFDLSWYTLDGGGGTSIGGTFRLSGTIGQVDAGGVLAGGEFTLTGGFQTQSDSSSAIFQDGFESGGITAWSSSAGFP